jgi:hypothetical protein
LSEAKKNGKVAVIDVAEGQIRRNILIVVGKVHIRRSKLRSEACRAPLRFYAEPNEGYAGGFWRVVCG